MPESGGHLFDVILAYWCWTRSMSRSTTSVRSLAPGCCCPPRSRSGWGSSRAPTSWSISVTGRWRPAQGAAAYPGPRHGRGGDCIDDVELLRYGSTQAVLGHRVMAASTVGRWLRAFTFGHVRQLDPVCGEILGRVWAAGAGPGLTTSLDARRSVSSR
jgi:hypothetical protein